jgi:hypothetical protein
MADAGAKRTPSAKGTAFLGIFKLIKSRPEGAELLDRAISSLSPQYRDLFKRKVFAIKDYPYAAFVELIRTVDRLLGKGDQAFCREIGRFTAVLDMQSVYNLYKKAATPRDLARDGDIIWKSYYSNAGQMKTEDVSPENTLVRIYDFPEMDPAHCRLMEGWMEQAIVESGGVWLEEIRETKCAARGDEYHEFRGRWKAKNS